MRKWLAELAFRCWIGLDTDENIKAMFLLWARHIMEDGSIRTVGLRKSLLTFGPFRRYRILRRMLVR